MYKNLIGNKNPDFVRMLLLKILVCSSNSYFRLSPFLTPFFSYSKNARELRALLKAKPYTPEETFVRYSEFAARFDLHERLDLYGRHLSFVEFYNLDVCVFLILSLSTVLLILFLVLRCCFRCAKRRVCKQKKE